MSNYFLSVFYLVFWKIFTDSNFNSESLKKKIQNKKTPKDEDPLIVYIFLGGHAVGVALWHGKQ